MREMGRKNIGDDVNFDFLRARNALLKLQVSRKINDTAKLQYLKMLRETIDLIIQSIEGKGVVKCK